MITATPSEARVGGQQVVVVEQAETRLNDTARASADQQDRMATILAQALSSLKERLDTVERQVASERTPPPRVEFPVEEALTRFVWPRERVSMREIVALLSSGDAGPVEDVLRIR